MHPAARRGRGGVPADAADVLDHAVLGNDLAVLGHATVGRILDAAERALPEHFAALRQALQQNDLARAAELAHAIRSAAAAAGFSALFESAGDLEHAAAAGDAAAARGGLGACEADYPPAMAAARRLVMERV